MDLEKELASQAQVNSFTADDMPSSFSDTMAASFALLFREERSLSASLALSSRREKVSDRLVELGGDRNLADAFDAINPAIRANLRKSELNDELELNPYWRGMAPWTQDAYQHVRSFERRFPNDVPTDEQLMDQFAAESAELRAGEQHTMARGSGLATFVGAAGAVMTDPLVLATLPFGAGAGAGRGALAAALRVGRVEAGIAMATEIPIQAEVFRLKREIESPWSFQQSAINILAAGAGGFILGGTIAGGIAGTRRILANYRAAKEAGTVRATPEMDEAEQILEDTIGLHDENPLESPLRAEGEPEPPPPPDPHERAFEDARVQHTDNRPVDVREDVAGLEPDDGVNQVISRSEDPGELVDVDPREVQIDAETFQFKSGSDGVGVNDTLRDVQTFDRRLAGVSLIWERADGTQFIADGHQRVALGRRSIAAGQDPAEVRLNAFVLREADGVTAIDARRMAAVKNMAEGTGSALDAAKLLRDIGPVGEAMLPPLPPRSALVRQARGLANLGEEEFLQIVNGIIPERFGALVGVATSEPKLQQAMIGVLRRTKPANETQARSIIDQVRTAGTETRITEDLFGAQQVTESLYIERAQVLDAALREARKDKAVFGRLLSEEGRITETGTNRLDRNANLERMQEASNAQTQISRLANSKGPISEALTEAARQVKAGKKPAEVSGAFLETTKRTLLEGDRGGREAGRARPRGDQARIDEPVDDFEFEPNDRLTLTEQGIEADFKEKLRTTPWEDLKTEYAGLEESGDGRVLSVDAARELSPDYLRDRTLSNAVHEPASAFIRRLYVERLAEAATAKQLAEVVFTAGGTGAGKTTGLKFMKGLKDSQIIMDGNLAKTASAIKKIEQALAAGKRVTVNYVYRDPIEALLNGAMKRAMKQLREFGTGRTVPIRVHASTSTGARETILNLAKKYAGDDRVAVMMIDNSNGRGKAAVGNVEKIPEMDQNRIIEQGLELIDEAEADARITKEIAEGFRGQTPEAGPAARRGDVGIDQPGGPRGARPGAAAEQGQLKPAPTIDAAPRSIVRAVDDARAPTPDPTRTGTIPDTEYAAIMAEAEALIADQGALARVGREINGEVQSRTLASELEHLDALEDTLERIRICSFPGGRAA